MRPDARAIALVKVSGQTIQRANVLLASLGLPTVLETHWHEITKKVAQGYEHLANEVGNADFKTPSLARIMRKVLSNKNLLIAIYVMLVSDYMPDQIARAITISGYGLVQPEDVVIFRDLFFDLSLCNQSEFDRYIKRAREDIVHAILQTYNEGPLKVLLSLGIVPEVGPDEYLKLLVSTAYKTLYEILIGEREITDPMEVIDTGLKAVELMKKESTDEAQELIKALRNMIEIQTVQDEDRHISELMGPGGESA